MATARRRSTRTICCISSSQGSSSTRPLPRAGSALIPVISSARLIQNQVHSSSPPIATEAIEEGESRGRARSPDPVRESFMP